uniref:Lipoprotein n=1 Tax=Globodera pallida TaxID=36090 RepID=A0A183CBR3_GLOPA
MGAIGWEEKAKDDDENSFQISFNPKYAAINKKEAQILGDKGKYRSYTIYTQMKNTPKSESSSTENQLVKMYKKATTCFGKK